MSEIFDSDETVRERNRKFNAAEAKVLTDLRAQLSAEREAHAETKRLNEFYLKGREWSHKDAADLRRRLADATNAAIRECALEVCPWCAASNPVILDNGCYLHKVSDAERTCRAHDLRRHFPDAFASAAEPDFQPRIATPEHVAEKVEYPCDRCGEVRAVDDQFRSVCNKCWDLAHLKEDDKG